MRDGIELEKEVEEKLPNIKAAVMGTDRELYKTLPFGMKKMATDKVCIFYDNKTADIIDLSEYEESEKLKEIDNIIKIINTSIEDKKNFQTLHSDSKAFKKVEKKAENLLEGKDYSTLKKWAARAGVALGVTLAVTGCNKIVDNLDKQRIADELGNVPDMDGKDLAFYSANALDTKQKQLFLNNITTWLEDANANENWMRTKLTQAQMEQYSLTESESVFGFTAENAYSLALRFGHYSNDEYVALTGGKEMDTVAIMNDAHSQSNGALASIITYYICSDECDLNIETLINFNENEIARINQIESMLREFKSLQAQDKEQEAKAKMIEMKKWFNEYAHSVDYEQDNAKSYILRTFLPACSALSQIYQYTDTIELDVYDTKNDVNTTKEIKTALFDEITMRTLVLGFEECAGVGAFDAEAYLEEHNISPERYNLLNTDITSSLADQSVSGQVEKLEQANIYISNLRNDDLTAEAAYAKNDSNIIIDLAKGRIGDQVAEQMPLYGNVITNYDELIYGTYESDLLLEMVNNYLKSNNIYPKNMNYFRGAKLSEISIEYKDNHGITQGNKGDVIHQKHEENVNIDDIEITDDDVVIDDEGDETTIDEAKEEAEEENEDETGIEDADDPGEEEEKDKEKEQEAITRQQLLQGVYNATFNYYNGGSVIEDGFDTSNTYGQTYTAAWANSSDAKIVEYYNKGKEDGLEYKKAREAAEKETGGEEVIDDDYDDAEITDGPVEPVPSEDNTTDDTKEPEDEKENEDGYSDEEPEDYTPVVDDNQPEDNTPSNEPADSDGDGIYDEFEDAEITEDPTTPEQSIDNTTENEDGYTDKAPEGFAPVVDEVSSVSAGVEYTNEQVVYFTEEELMNYINTEEGNAWFESVTSSEEFTNTNEIGKTK